MASPEQILEWYDEEMRKAPPLTGKARRESLADVTRVIWEGEVKMGAIQYSRLSEENAQAVIERERKHFADLRLDFEWKLYSHDRPADLGARLAALGATVGDEESLVALDLEKIPKAEVPPGLTIERVTNAAGFEEIAKVNRAVWDLDNDELILALKEEHALAPDSLSLYVVRDGAKAVSTGWTRFYRGSRFSDLWGGSTLREYRGRGIYRALVALRAEEARRRGAKYLCVDASAMSRPILGKIGFKKLCSTTPYYFSWKDYTS